MASSKKTLTTDEITQTPINAETPEKAVKKPAVPEKTAAQTVTKKNSPKTADKKKSSASKTSQKVRKLIEQTDDIIFALDIGTRTVVGILGQIKDGIFNVLASHSEPHPVRAMMDGQIEDINQVSRIVELVKTKLEKLSGYKLTKVAIAAAGRALKTTEISMDFSIDDRDILTDDDVKAFEIETVMKAQAELNKNNDVSGLFYCVGHTVISYELDGYKIKTLVGHRGKKAFVNLIAAFLPSGVVESLYAVTDNCKLEVVNLTLEPIAAMHVIIPPEVRLINIALADIGAGTSDIAVSRGGSIVAYAMATVAGDEITEEIIKTYLVSFDTAEEMKLSGGSEDITYTDILGYTHTIKTEKFFKDLFPAVGTLSDTIAQTIKEANGAPPAAVFLIGGGSKLPELTSHIAERLGLPPDRVAVGGKSNYKNIRTDKAAKGSCKIDGPEFVTPIGIGLAAAMSGGYDFSVVNLNGKKLRIFDTKTISVFDLLILGGYKSNQILGRSGKILTYTINNETRNIPGTPAVPSELTLGGKAVSLDTPVHQGDEIRFTPAKNGTNARVFIRDFAKDVNTRFVTVDDDQYPIGKIVTVSGRPVTAEYEIRQFDRISVTDIVTLGDLFETLPFDCAKLDFYKGGKLLQFDYLLEDGDMIITAVKTNTAKVYQKRIPADSFKTPEITVMNDDEDIDGDEILTPKHLNSTEKTQNPLENPAPPSLPPEEFAVTLNGKQIVLPPRPDHTEHEFIELMPLADVDFEKPPADADIVITLNGKDVSFIDKLHVNDTAVIKWQMK
ncbi:MAG: rod shape-determining protein [Ruminococcus sp.]|nr:rod shape-determining protein [Ruminococcus sp.]